MVFSLATRKEQFSRFYLKLISECKFVPKRGIDVVPDDFRPADFFLFFPVIFGVANDERIAVGRDLLSDL